MVRTPLHTSWETIEIDPEDWVDIYPRAGKGGDLDAILGRWSRSQRREYEKDRLPTDKRTKLEALPGWKHYVSANPKGSDARRRRDEKMLRACQDYDRKGKWPPWSSPLGNLCYSVRTGKATVSDEVTKELQKRNFFANQRELKREENSQKMLGVCKDYDRTGKWPPRSSALGKLCNSVRTGNATVSDEATKELRKRNFFANQRELKREENSQKMLRACQDYDRTGKWPPRSSALGILCDSVKTGKAIVSEAVMRELRKRNFFANQMELKALQKLTALYQYMQRSGGVPPSRSRREGVTWSTLKNGRGYDKKVYSKLTTKIIALYERSREQ